MPVLSAAVALGLMAYVPGRVLLRLLLPGEKSEVRGRLLLEMLLGNGAVALIGLPLAELGIFSLPAVLVGLAAATAIAWALTRGRRLGAYGAADAAGLVIALAALAWLIPPFDTTLYGYDSSVYVAGGRSLERHGGLAFVDPTIGDLPLAARREFFPGYDAVRGGPPYFRVPGGLLLDSLEQPVVLPAFHHLLSVWVALSQAIGGDSAATAPAGYFGALSLWALLAFADALGGPLVAAVSAVLLLLSAPQYWYSRFLMPEVPSQYFLWAGLLAAGVSIEVPGLLGVAAGIGLGVAGLMRLDGLAHTVAALALWRVLVPSRWPAGRGFGVAFASLAAYAVLHQVLFPTHYSAELKSLVGAVLPRLPGGAGAAVALAGVVAGLTVIAWAVSARAQRLAIRVGGLLLFGGYAVTTLATTRPDPLMAGEWLRLYLGWPVLLAAVAGAVAWWRAAALPSQRFGLLLGAIVLVQLAYDPRVTPAPLWAIRRSVPVVVPVLLLSAALLASVLGRGRRWLAALGLALFVAGSASRSSLSYGRGEILEGNREHVRAISALLPPGAVAVYDPEFALDTQFHIALWGMTDTPAYVLGADMGEPLRDLRHELKDRPLYWISATPPKPYAAITRIAEPIASYRYGAVTRRLDWYDTREDLGLRDVTVWIYRLAPGGEPPALH